jgi:hypothetical protein
MPRSRSPGPERRLPRKRAGIQPAHPAAARPRKGRPQPRPPPGPAASRPSSWSCSGMPRGQA